MKKALPSLVAGLMAMLVAASVANARVLVGTGDNDRLIGTSSKDTIYGKADSDVLAGRGGGDVLVGGRGADRLSGGTGADRLLGGTGPDQFLGGTGADQVSGGLGNDFIISRSGGRDSVSCGGGVDTVVADASDRVSASCEVVGEGGTSGGELLNVTLRIPAEVRPNPCTPGDVVNLSGILHLIIYIRGDGQGGYHVTLLVSERLQGRSLTTSEAYVASDVYDHSFYAGGPFPVTDTTTHSVELVSRGDSPNLLMSYTLHTTVSATGVPTATITNVRLDCQG